MPEPLLGADAEWLTITEAARLLGISNDTLRRYDNQGVIRARRTPGNQRRFRRSDLLALLEGKAS